MRKIDFNLLEGIIWDMDGVLIDVNNSYRRAIKKTAQYFCDGKKIAIRDVNKIKQFVGLNNDWDASFALILSKNSVEFKVKTPRPWKGGESSYVAVLLPTSSGAAPSSPPVEGRGFRLAAVVVNEFVQNLESFRKKKQYQKIIDIFQSYYLGSGLYQKCYKTLPPLKVRTGLIKREQLMISKVQLNKLRNKYKKMAIVTGRPRFEAEYALKINKIENLFDILIAMEDTKRGKPYPDSLLKVIQSLNLEKAVYIGDSVNDVFAAQKAKIPCLYLGKEKLGDIQVKNINQLMEVLL